MEYWGETPVVIDHAETPIAVFVFAHGAGAGMGSDFMAAMAQRLSKLSVTVVRFDFPYMALAAQLGKRRPPDRADKLLACWQLMLEECRHRFDLPVFIGGKSMGGRMATLLASSNAEGIAGVLCFGYPFHPLGKPEKTRIDHLPSISIPVVVFQGERDKFGLPDEVSTYNMPVNISVKWMDDGDHDLRPRKSSGLTWEQNLDNAADASLEFVKNPRKWGV